MDDRPWIFKEIDRLKSIVPKPGDAEESAKQIEKRLEKLYMFVRLQEPGSFAKDRMTRIFQWHDQGFTCADIGKIVGASKRTIEVFLEHRESLEKYYTKKGEEQ